MPMHLFRCKVTNILNKEWEWAWTDAHSHKQALAYFCQRYSYPPHTLGPIRDMDTGVVMEKEDEIW